MIYQFDHSLEFGDEESEEEFAEDDQRRESTLREEGEMASATNIR